MKDFTRDLRIIFSRRRGRFRVDPLDLHGNRDGQHPLAIFVPEFDYELTGITLRQLVSAAALAAFRSAASRLFLEDPVNVDSREPKRVTQLGLREGELKTGAFREPHCLKAQKHLAEQVGGMIPG